MDGKTIARKVTASIALIALAIAVFAVAPAGLQLVIALVALPIEMLMLATILVDADRRIPQAQPRA
jgi:hypothetical protein